MIFGMRILDELFSLRGRTALVTGGSSGIGYAMAETIALAGARTVLLARREAELEAAAERIRKRGGEAAGADTQVRWVAADVADRARLARPPRRRSDWSVRSTSWSTAPASTRDPRWVRRASGTTTASWREPRRAVPARPALRAADGRARLGPDHQRRVAAERLGVRDSGVYGVSKAGIAGLTRSQARPGRRVECV